ncbi:MAG: HAD family hydrolase [candidate division Zixibacteria bacterium]
MNLKLCFFDIDGTLIRRSGTQGKSLKTRSINYALEKVFEIEGIDYMSILGKRIYGMTDSLIMRAAVAEYGIDADHYRPKEPELFKTIDDYFDAHLEAGGNNDYVRLPGVVEFLDYLKAKNIRLGLVTGNIEKHSEWKMINAGFDSYFNTGAYGSDAEHRWEILTVALKRNSDVSVRSVCHFGDSPADLDAAKRCGIKAVGICDKGGGTHTREELAEIDYGLIIDSWYERDMIEEYLSH